MSGSKLHQGPTAEVIWWQRGELAVLTFLICIPWSQCLVEGDLCDIYYGFLPDPAGSLSNNLDLELQESDFLQI